MDDEGDDALDGGDVNYGGDDELIDKIFQQEKLIKNYVESEICFFIRIIVVEYMLIK